MKIGPFRSLRLLALTLTCHIGLISATTADSASVRLPGHVLEDLSDAVVFKEVSPNKQIAMSFTLPLRNQAELEQLLQKLYDPNDVEYYGKYLSPDEFADKFVPTEEDYQQVVNFAQKIGLTVLQEQSNRTLLSVSGPAKSVEEAFDLKLYQYQKRSGRAFYAPDRNPAVPLSMAALIKGIVGLDNQAEWKPRFKIRNLAELPHAPQQEAATFPSGPHGGFSPKDLIAAYNLESVAEDGMGQAIALFELASYQASDINTYTHQFGLPTAKLTNVLVDGGSKSGINAEVTLDIELALALAPASQIYVYEGPNTNQGVLDTYNRIATDNKAKQVSTSWGLGENLVTTQFLQAEKAIFMQMAAQGQSMYAAAGDSGAYDDYSINYSKALVVDDPASQPYVTGVGGTTLKVDTQTGAYVSEAVWDNGLGNGAGGGGVSQVWPIPSWQQNVATVYSKTYRNVPDISLNADTNTGYAIFHAGQWNIYGGTSCAAPLWAAFNARVNQKLASQSQPALGFVNATLYPIAQGSLGASCFHDVTVGNNLYYACKTGYDNATGWGTLNGANLFAALTNSSAPPVLPPVSPPVSPPEAKPAFNLSLTHTGTFHKGQIGSYLINLSNSGMGVTTGQVSVSVTLPSGLIYLSSSGSGWDFKKNPLTFTRSDALPPGTAYPPITINVFVGWTAYAVATTYAGVSGGEAAPVKQSDSTDIK